MCSSVLPQIILQEFLNASISIPMEIASAIIALIEIVSRLCTEQFRITGKIHLDHKIDMESGRDCS